MKKKKRTNRNHEADIKNGNKKTKGKNDTYTLNQINKERQLKEERDKKANENNPNYKKK